MRVLWVVNTLFPAACERLGLKVPVVGGWMYASAKSLLDMHMDVDLVIASLYDGDGLVEIMENNITYVMVPKGKSRNLYNIHIEEYWKAIKKKYNPDVIHIHGSEYPHGLAYVNGCGNDNVVVSIQGLISVIERYYFAGIRKISLVQNMTLRDVLKNDSVINQHRQIRKRGEYEENLYRKVNHVIGRTSWDQAHTWAINPDSKYSFCNETLRSEFYQYEWKLDKCEKFSIFLSQAYYPLKGMQQLIKALPLILRQFPDVKVYVAGDDFLSKKRKWRLTGFAKYIRSLIKEYGVEDKIVFTGILSEKQMCQQYLKSNIFVCPSSIENSSNSVGEAQLLGVPCVAAAVGGMKDMVEDGITGFLYRFEEVEMLAHLINKVFENNNLANDLSRKGRAVALERHSRINNTNTLVSIYKSICRS